ncbi:hypothetical protein TRFO_10426 [Tritrichomonas foetus]|uniref:Uncharacterized protein n=1 Tax=Tritrichomonas foetus TaxID=1144522 RepID=A0A1J4J8N4_9EUKA|nr:hypothetical protein TRFO_10426 [Tritrichomonas foetus]|eukprot:OHS95542.1 hypothetical protein TRFO_10426 [Tritrichomonas foetus]
MNFSIHISLTSFYRMVEFDSYCFLDQDMMDHDENEEDFLFSFLQGDDHETVYDYENQVSERNKKELKKKEKIVLTKQGKHFRNRFYQEVFFGEAIQKKYIKMMHDLICDKIDLPQMSRKEDRCINAYFNRYAQHQNIIIAAAKVEFEKNKSLWLKVLYCNNPKI